MTDAAVRTSTHWLGLIVLAALMLTGTAMIFLPSGLLPDIARDVGVPESQVGLLVTFFTFTVAATTAPLVFATRRVPRKTLLVAVVLVVAAGGVITGLAPSFAVIAVGRISGGLVCGLLFAGVIAYSARLVPPHLVGRAVSITSIGGALTNIVALPTLTAAGQQLGWRFSFLLLAGIVALLALVAAVVLPSVTSPSAARPAEGEARPSALKDPTLPGALFACLVMLVFGIGHFALFSFVAPYVIGPVGFDPVLVAPAILVIGTFGAIGTLFWGAVADRLPRAVGFISMGIIVLGILILSAGAGNAALAWVGLAVWSVGGSGTPVALQTRMLRVASPLLRDAASGYFVIATNIGIGLGAIVGGAVLELLGVAALPYVAVGAIVLAALLLFVGVSRTARPAVTVEPAVEAV